MKTIKYLLIALLLPTIFLTSCKDDPVTDAQPAFDLLTEYLVAQDMDLSHIITTPEGKKFVTGAPADDAAVADWATGFHIIDIRTADAFAAGHIPGAINTAFADVPAEAAKATKPVLVVCVTGQTACYATSLLRLGGVDAQSLKWGMSGWNADFDKWTGNCNNSAKDHANWTSTAAPQNNVYDNPTIITTAADGAGILAQQLDKVWAAGFKNSGADGGVYDVLENPTAYHINNYFSEADYGNFGHVNGAYRINPLLLHPDSKSYMGLNPDGKVITYCYTGQTSAVITAYLNVIGYDAYSLLFGMNGLYNSNAAWTTNQWGGDSKSKSLSYESN